MIKCSECNGSFSEKALTCPHCGVKNAQRVVFCSECGEKYLAHISKCPKCGKANVELKKGGKAEVVRDDGKTALAYLLFAIFLGCWGGHLFYAGHKKWAIVTLVLNTAGWLILPVGIFGVINGIIQSVTGIVNGVTHMDNPDPLFDSEPKFWGIVK